jgi:hypothetical protein
LVVAGCGYRVAGRGSTLPAEIQTLAVTPFENQTSWMRLEQRLTSAVMEEFIHRTRYRIVGDGEAADAVLRGTILSVRTVPVIFDPETGAASAVQLEVRLSADLREQGSERTLYANPTFVFREQYEITGDLDSFFEERSTAVERLSRDFAASLVSAILENF